MSQLDGVEDIAKKCVDILSMSLHPSSETRESTLSIRSSVEFVEVEARRRSESLFNECTEDVKLITEASSWKKIEEINKYI